MAISASARGFSSPAPRAQHVAEQIRQKARDECDLRVVAKIRARVPSPAWFRKRRRPLEAGLSPGHFSIAAGTLGFVVEDHDAFYVLSDKHVLANVNVGQPADPVVPPGPTDRKPSPATLIGVLDRFVPISFRRSNVVDCALAALTEDLECFVGWTEAIPGRVTRTAPVTTDDLGRPVRKAGSTTGVTTGTITQVEVDRLRVDMSDDEHKPMQAVFSDHFELQGIDGRPFSLPGDPGSLIVAGRQAIGLLFAGGPDENNVDLTFANRIDTVPAKLGVALVT